jgi:hypothetical protein
LRQLRRQSARCVLKPVGALEPAPASRLSAGKQAESLISTSKDFTSTTINCHVNQSKITQCANGHGLHPRRRLLYWWLHNAPRRESLASLIRLDAVLHSANRTDRFDLLVIPAVVQRRMASEQSDSERQHHHN